LGKTYDLGFLGGGQLARMSIHAAQRMGFRCLSLDPGGDTPASQVADAVQGQLDDPPCIAQIFESCAYVTLENEFIPAEAIQVALHLAGREEACLTPGLGTLATIQDKLLQRRAYEAAGVPSPRAFDFEPAMAWPGPTVLKARFGGYDGKGTRYARTAEEWAANTTDLSGGWLVEDFVPFERELAVMVFVGDHEGTFPTMETVQTRHVCDLVFPVENAAVDDRARAVALAAVRAVNGRGLFGVELFELADGQILVNEMAPRPHNTGHYSLDWGGTSQFEQHVRLSMGLPADPGPHGFPTCMANILGVEGSPNLARATGAALTESGVHVHWYGKAEMRPGRKVGHINAVGENCRERAIRARERFFHALI
jgi:5-(carboxyamino)imidazole ribonucleotide synthase